MKKKLTDAELILIQAKESLRLALEQQKIVKDFILRLKNESPSYMQRSYNATIVHSKVIKYLSQFLNIHVN